MSNEAAYVNPSFTVLIKVPVEDQQHEIRNYDRYVVLVPRGLEHVVSEMIRQQLLPTCDVTTTTTLLGEEYDNIPALVGTVRDKINEMSTKNHKARDKQVLESICSVSVGTVELTPNQHVSVGYSTSSNNIWTKTGQIQGTVWMEISTNAPASIIANMRCLGPILALVTVYDDDVDLNEGQTLDEAAQRIQHTITNDKLYVNQFQSALQLWRKHVHDCWPAVLGNNFSVDPTRFVDETTPLKYRVSCLRNDSKRFQYTRRELLGVVDGVIPSTPPYNSYTVDLTRYDLEMVLLQRAHSFLVGIALRPYQLLQTRSFASGELPPDISSPFLVTGPRLVRLRPTTAQVLLHLANLQTGDVVLDPCSGIGTIPMEAYIPDRKIVGIGGDLIMNDPVLNAVAVEYKEKASDFLRNATDPEKICHRKRSVGNRVADLVAWDAAFLPIRSESIDAIVTDLPFGQLCMSASRLDAFLPLFLSEMARILRRWSGRMVLLCGSYIPILKALKHANDCLVSSSNSVVDTGLVWDLPCSAVFPVNVGGNLAWIVQVRRCGATAKHLPSQWDRIKKQVHKREHTAKMTQNIATRTKHPQS
jgi:Putative RNA methylase family UPF0020